MTGKGNTMRMVWLAVAFLGTCLSLSAETRTWVDATGVRFEGTYNKELLGGVQIRDLNGGNHLIRMEQLSKVDLDYIEHHVPPKVEADIDFDTRMLPRTEWTRDDDDTTVYAFTVTVEKKSKLRHKGRLSAELFVLANERSLESNKHLVLMQRTKTDFVFSEQQDDVYEFTVPDIQFSAYRASWIQLNEVVRRGKTYLGYIIAITDENGRIIFSDTDIAGIRWLTDDLPFSVEKLRDLYINHHGSAESRHFNHSFKKIDPPRIPWFQRTTHD